jgi:arginine exporter protein ArgO
MAKKILVVYVIYTVVVFLFNTYIIKEIYTDALIKAVLSGVVFTVFYAFIVMRNEKKQAEKQQAESKPVRKKK